MAEPARNTQNVSSATPSSTLQILIVTESLVDQKLASKLLSKHSHRIVLASTAAESIEKCRETAFDVVLVDCFQAGSVHQSLANMLREGGVHRPRIILVMTDNDEQRPAWQSLGFDGFVEKPVRIEQITRALESRRSSASVIPLAPDATDHTVGPAEEVESVEWSVALDAVGGRNDLLRDLVDIFLSEYPGTMDEIRAAIDAANIKQLQLSAHKLKGCLRYFGPNQAGRIAEQMEENARAGQIDGAAESFSELTLAVTRLLPALKKLPGD